VERTGIAACARSSFWYKAVGFPSLDMAVVITSTNYNTPGMHQQTERLLADFILGALASS
jgi:hypothetical protein